MHQYTQGLISWKAALQMGTLGFSVDYELTMSQQYTLFARKATTTVVFPICQGRCTFLSAQYW